MDINAEVQELKMKGNTCFKSENYAEAVLHYSHGIKLDPENYSLYSNRSLAFLKMQQFYLAMEDAKQTIRLKPDWAKGYFRKAEVEFSTFHFSDALLSYSHALQLQPKDPSIMEAMLRASQERQKDRKADDQIPWLGAGVGIIMGVIIVIADHILTHKPTLGEVDIDVSLEPEASTSIQATTPQHHNIPQQVSTPSNKEETPYKILNTSLQVSSASYEKSMPHHPLLMALLTIAVAMVGYGMARGFRYYVKCQRTALLEPPVDLLPEEPKEPDPSSCHEPVRNERSHRYTKAQARQRFKRGKM